MIFFMLNYIKKKQKEIIAIMTMKMILKLICFMKELINYLLNFVMIIAVNVMKLVIQLIDKNVYHAKINIFMIIGIIKIITLIQQIVFLSIICLI